MDSKNYDIIELIRKGSGLLAIKDLLNKTKAPCVRMSPNEIYFFSIPGDADDREWYTLQMELDAESLNYTSLEERINEYSCFPGEGKIWDKTILRAMLQIIQEANDSIGDIAKPVISLVHIDRWNPLDDEIIPQLDKIMNQNTELCITNSVFHLPTNFLIRWSFIKRLTRLRPENHTGLMIDQPSDKNKCCVATFDDSHGNFFWEFNVDSQNCQLTPTASSVYSEEQ